MLQQYNVATMTARTPNRDLAPADVLELNATDARAVGVHDRDTAEVTSRWGKTRVPVHISERVRPGTAFLTFHFADSHTNQLTGPHVDPKSKCPEYKITAIRVTAA
jgi:predicted molibdopterin-dependent oxidoreductase YjgC